MRTSIFVECSRSSLRQLHRSRQFRLLERPYRLIFQASPGCIDILTIKHYRQRLPAQATNL